MFRFRSVEVPSTVQSKPVAWAVLKRMPVKFRLAVGRKAVEEARVFELITSTSPPMVPVLLAAAPVLGLGV